MVDIGENSSPHRAVQSSSICIGLTWYLFEILHLGSQQLCGFLVLFGDGWVPVPLCAVSAVGTLAR